MADKTEYFQDSFAYNHCVGCGRTNERGLQIKSHWDEHDSGTAVCDFEPRPHQSAYPLDVLNGGIIATLIDCHSIGTSIADGYRRAGRPIGDGDVILYATASLNVSYQKPTPISGPVRVVARVVEATERKTTVESTVLDKDGVETASGEVVAVVVPAAWANPKGLFSGG